MCCIRYSRGGGVIAWRNSIMLFVNADPEQSKYVNKFLENGRKLVWFPAAGQTQYHPLIQRLLAASRPRPQGQLQVPLQHCATSRSQLDPGGPLFSKSLASKIRKGNDAKPKLIVCLDISGLERV